MNAKKYLAGLFIVTLLSTTFVFSARSVRADDVSLSELIELFISLGFIPAEKAAQARAAAAQLNASESCNSVTIKKDLALGSKGQDVADLQTFLAKDSSLYPGGLVTSYYGPATQQAVQRFQKKYGIVSSGTGYGVVGPKTRAELAKCHAASATKSTTSANTKPTITFLYPAARSVYSTNERLTVVTQVSGVNAATARVRFYLSGGVYKSTWQELDQTYTTGGYATLTIPQETVSVWGAGTAFKIKAELEVWEVGAFVKKAEATMSNTFTLSPSVIHSVYYTTGTNVAAQAVYLKLKDQANEFGTTFTFAGVDSFDINSDGAADVIGFLNSAQGPLCGSKGCRVSLWVSSSASSNDRTPVYFDTAQYRNAHGSVMVLNSKTDGYYDLAFLSTSGKFDLWRWDGDSYIFSRTVDVLPNLGGQSNTNNNSSNNSNNSNNTGSSNTNTGGVVAPPPPPPPPAL